MRRVRDPDRCQLARAVQLGQHHRVAAIGLHPVSRFDRDQRQGHHHTLMPATGQQSMQPMTTRAGLVAKAQATPPFAQPGCQFRQKRGTVLEDAELAKLAAAATLGKRNTDCRLVRIQSDIGDSIHQARFACMRLCASYPAQPSTFCMSRGGPPITQRTSGLVVRYCTAIRSLSQCFVDRLRHTLQRFRH